MNSSSSLDASGSLASGSADNIRFEIISPNTSSGTFGLLIRQGNDNNNNKIILESYTNLSLDPKSPNYISSVIGDYTYNYNSVNVQIELSGSYPNASRYVRVKSVALNTPDYLDNTGTPKTQFTGSIPVAASGSFTGATDTMKGGAAFYDDITTAGNTQGLDGGSYTNMVNLLSNSDDYKFNILLTPGLFNSLHTGTVSTIISNTQGRGDNLYVLDLVPYSSTTTAVVGQASAVNNSYAASYWPWCQIQDPATGKNVWVPASTVIAGVYAYNDKVAEPWFAPAGINRGGLGNVIRVEQKLSQTTRDTLYLGKVNPIATFPGTGVVVYGNKTLQTQASALDRVNVRRLLISLKSYIGQVANTIVFEQNTVATRNQFLGQVNPYLESVQQRQGVYAFKVVMNDSNNTPDVIDRNQLVGAIYIQPTKTAEFIYLNFNITPTGTTFPA
jgi:phage tail sheath protein FI